MSLLPVPHRLQREPGECLAACAAMALDYLNLSPDYDRLVRQLRIQRRVGASFHNLRLLESLGVRVLVDRGELDALRDCVERGLPPIVLVDTAQLSYWSEATAHAVVVIGLTDDSVYLNDPAFQNAPQVVSLNEFYLAWIDLDQFYALIQLE